MTFLKYPNGDWWEWDTENMKAYNICGEPELVICWDKDLIGTGHHQVHVE